MPLLLPEKKSPISADLRRMIGPQKVKDDLASLQAYSVDASIYKDSTSVHCPTGIRTRH